MLRTVLVVDDDDATRVGLVALLEGAGYAVVAADSLKAARKVMTEVMPDLLITDVRLGEFNGLHLAASNHQQLPVIVITGFPDPVLEQVARQFGAEFLQKPVRPAALLELIERKLAMAPDDAAFHPARRWPRKRLTKELEAQVDTVPMRVVDVSYGGLSLASQSAPTALPQQPALQVTFPGSAISLRVQVVWERLSDATWMCGARLADESRAEWHQFVDAIA